MEERPCFNCKELVEIVTPGIKDCNERIISSDPKPEDVLCSVCLWAINRGRIKR